MSASIPFVERVPYWIDSERIQLALTKFHTIQRSKTLKAMAVYTFVKNKYINTFIIKTINYDTNLKRPIILEKRRNSYIV